MLEEVDHLFLLILFIWHFKWLTQIETLNSNVFFFFYDLIGEPHKCCMSNDTFGFACIETLINEQVYISKIVFLMKHFVCSKISIRRVGLHLFASLQCTFMIHDHFWYEFRYLDAHSFHTKSTSYLVQIGAHFFYINWTRYDYRNVIFSSHFSTINSKKGEKTTILDERKTFDCF